MMARGFGRIVNIVSRSVKTPQAELGLSNGARAGLVGFVAGLARQTVRHNVTINNILPGAVAPDAQRQHVEALASAEGRTFDQLWHERSQANPAGRFGRAPEVGALCAYLCSSQAGYLTGQSLLIDGGGCPGTF
jgi:3-oxoacyl-[acyl-carrier protein] reductase